MTRNRINCAFELLQVLIGLALFSFLAIRATDNFNRFGFGLVAADFLFIMVWRIRALRKAWAAVSMRDAGTRTVDFQRRALQSRLVSDRRAFYVSFPMLVAVMILLINMIIRDANNPHFRVAWDAIGLFSFLMGLWGVHFIVGRREMHRRFQREIAALDALEKDVE